MPVFHFKLTEVFWGEVGLQKSQQEYCDMHQTRAEFLLMSDEGYWLSVFFFFYREKWSRKGPHLFKKRVGQRNHLPTWFNLKTEFEEGFSDVGGLFPPPFR